MSDSFIFVADLDQRANQQNSKPRPRLKRRRGACESCRNRKVRCNGNHPCDQCRRSSVDCQYRNMSGRQRVLSSGSPKLSRTNCDAWNQTSDGANCPPGNSPLSPPPSSSSNIAPTGPSAIELNNQAVTSGSEALHEQSDLTLLTNVNTLSEEWDWQNLFASEGLNMGEDISLFTMSSTYSGVDTVLGPPELETPNGAADTAVGSNCARDLEPDTRPATIHGNSAEVLSGELSRGYHFTAHFYSRLSESNLNLSRSQREQLSRVLEKLMAGRFEQRFAGNLEDVLINNAGERTRLYTWDFARKCINACYADPQGIRTLLGKESLEDAAYRVIDQSTDTPTAIALVSAVLAIGSQCVNLDDNSTIVGRSRHQVYILFEKALNTRRQLLEDISIQSLQALLAMTYFANQTGSDMVSGLLADAIYCVQTLRLNNNSAIRRFYPNQVEQENAKRAFWFLYSLEKPHCLREGMFPLIDEGFIDHTPPKPLGPPGDSDWLSINAEYATLCSLILKQLHEKSSCCRKQDCGHMAESVERLKSALRVWEDKLPFRCDAAHNRAINYSSLSCEERRFRLSNLYRYHWAVIAVHSVQTTERFLTQNEEICCESAREILATSCYISLADVLYDWSLYYVPSVATCILFMIIMRNQNNQKDLSYIGIASGFFGRLSLDADVPFHEVTELSRLAQQRMKDKRHQGDKAKAFIASVLNRT